MTAQRLKQLQHLKNEIKDLQNRHSSLSETLKEAADVVCGSSPNFPYTKHAIKIKGLPFAFSEHELIENIEQIKLLADQINEQKAKYLNEYHDLNEYIQNIPDSETRQILSYRYINGFTWGQVAAHISPYATEDSVKKIYQRFLKSCPECPD